MIRYKVRDKYEPQAYDPDGFFEESPDGAWCSYVEVEQLRVELKQKISRLESAVHCGLLEESQLKQQISDLKTQLREHGIDSVSD